MVVEVSTTNPRSLKALALLATAETWKKGHRKSDGRSFFIIPTVSGHIYWTDTRECDCPDHSSRGVACYHILACRLWIAQQKGETAQNAKRAQVVASDSHANCPVTVDTQATLAKLLAQQSEHVRTLRLLGYTPDEYHESAAYAQRASHIARLEACVERVAS